MITKKIIIKIEIHVDIDKIHNQWVIRISQLNGNFISKDFLVKEDFLEDSESEQSGGFRKVLIRAKNWIQIHIKSDGISRNPFSTHYTRAEEISFPEYEYRISLVN